MWFLNWNTGEKNRLPIYYRIEKELEKQIQVSSPGDQLPTENELIERFGVSRTPVRAALGELERKGLVVRKPGKGTFVARPRWTHLLTSLRGFTEEMKEMQIQSRSVVVESSLVPAGPDQQKSFGLSASGSVFFLSRIRFMGECAIALQNAFINVSLHPSLAQLQTLDFNGSESLYGNLARLGFPPHHGEEELRVEPISRAEARLLQCKSGICGLKRKRLTFLQDNRCIEFVDSVYIGEKYVFRFFLQ
ncbi:MAG TPA: GntR family transcriptional regulator [Thermotogota bacterium]|nr:GntR family transcriptional regulator [Thermotogota bacterium]